MIKYFWRNFMDKFVTFEGVEGAGKSTLVKNLCDYLQKNHINFKCVREPGGSKVCEQIRNIVKYIETDTEGNQSIYNAQKQLIRQLLKTENGYMEVNYDENGQIIENDDRQTVDEWELSDNITIERDPDGNVLRYIETDSKGSKVFIMLRNKGYMHR